MERERRLGMPEKIREAREGKGLWGTADLGKERPQKAERPSASRSRRGDGTFGARPRLRDLLGDFSEQIGAFFG
jgi:hypothetical protein